ncbi:hypothetical protein O6H91_Y229200 [Diphasiastrum complanatum]|nr:hypothetical protein O6H91_Y229200 [Diphasiastrum complanatum]
MGNKRQRLARKRFVGAGNGDVVLGLEPHAKKAKVRDGPEMSRKAEEGEGEEGETGDAEQKKQVKKAAFALKKHKRKHPLRVPGNKPGEGCFYCKSPDHIAKLCPKKNEQNRSKICLFCRERGHTLKDCPNGDKHQESKFCYNCGEHGHRLASCPEPLKDGGTSFAECFLCKKQGHISRNCPLNARGIYPKGGACKICGEVTHLAKDCPNKANRQLNSASAKRSKLQISTNVTPASLPGENGKRVVFKSGDDLEDDFDNEDHEPVVPDADFGLDDEENSLKEEMAALRSKNFKPKKSKTAKQLSNGMKSSSIKKHPKKHSPKVVNFTK